MPNMNLNALLAIGILMLGACEQTNKHDQYKGDLLYKLEYNNPGLLVDLDAGFKAVPMPMDFDGDGDYDLLISESGCYAESGIFYFENISGNEEMPIFRRRMKVSFERRRLGDDGSRFQVSFAGNHVHVLTPDRVREKLLIYKDVPQNVFWAENEVILPDEAYDYLQNYKTEWKIIDFDGDGIEDLVCAATRDRPRRYRGKLAKLAEDLELVIDGKSHMLFLKNTGSLENPVFENPEKILKVDGSSLAEGLSLKPMFADYDNDGDNDFISIGNYDDNIDMKSESPRGNDDHFIYFENTGTSSQYEFTVGKVMKNEGKPILMVSQATIHQVAIDWNKDGYVDIIAGDEDGKISFLKNTGKFEGGVPVFLQPRFFQQEAAYVDFGALVAPRIFDWDGDELDDIISGNGVGNIGFIKNLGGLQPSWDRPQLLESEGKPIRILPKGAPWGYTTIDVADWNHDELPDILVNHHHGNVLWYENIGSRTTPKLSEARAIEVEWNGEPQRPEWVPGKSQGNELLAPWRTSPFVMDFNSDGLNDLVMMDYQGYLSVYLREQSNGELILTHPQRSFVFPSGEQILINQRTGSSSGRLKITFHDWDGDGLKDLIVASKPAVDWMKNLGMKEDKMVLQYMGRILSVTLMGHTDGPVVSDFNKDNIPDLLVGAENGVFYYWQRSSMDITTTMTTVGEQKPANYPYFKR
jgi:hypothetical protein